MRRDYTALQENDEEAVREVYIIQTTESSWTCYNASTDVRGPRRASPGRDPRAVAQTLNGHAGRTKSANKE